MDTYRIDLRFSGWLNLESYPIIRLYLVNLKYILSNKAYFWGTYLIVNDLAQINSLSPKSLYKDAFQSH